MAEITYFDGQWVDGAPTVMGPMAQSFMHGSTVFDGARAFDGYLPDLDRHCARLVRSAEIMGIAPVPSAAEIAGIAREGVRRFPPGSALYIRPVIYSEDGFLVPEAGGGRFIMTIFDCPMPEPTGLSVCFSSYRRPFANMAPTDAKAACLYPLTSLAIREANDKGFDNAIMRDGDENVVEFASSNLWLAKDGVAITPAHNHTFLNGVTRQRVIGLLREAGREVCETTVSFDDVMSADEVFSTGNLAKVMPVTRVEDRNLQPGPVCQQARDLYFDFARTQPV